MSKPEQRVEYKYFTPWNAGPRRSCWSCAFATGYDGTHLWCTRHRLVVVDPRGWWMREPGADEREL